MLCGLLLREMLNTCARSWPIIYTLQIKILHVKIWLPSDFVLLLAILEVLMGCNGRVPDSRTREKELMKLLGLMTDAVQLFRQALVMDCRATSH